MSLKKGHKTFNYFIEVFTNNESEAYPNTISQLENFSGSLNIYTLEGKNIGSVSIYNGNAKTNDNSNISIANLVSLINFYKTKMVSSTGKYPTCTGQTTYQPYTSTVYIDKYDIWTNANTGAVIATIYTGTEIESVTTQYIQVSSPCGEARDPISISRTTSHYNPRIGYPSQNEFLEVFYATNPNIYDIEFYDQKDQVTAEAKFQLLPWCNLTISITQNKGVKYTTDKVSSSLNGTNIGFNWTQSNINESTNNNITTIIVTGAFEYTLFAKGIGNVHTQMVKYEIQINNTNGHIINGSKIY